MLGIGISRKFRHLYRLLALIGLGLFVYTQYPGYPKEDHNPVARSKPQTRRNSDQEDPLKPIVEVTRTPLIRQEETTTPTVAGTTVKPKIIAKSTPNHKLHIYEPTCPPHPSIDLTTAPYGYIPEGMRKESRIVCDGKNSRIRVYPGQVIELDNVVLDFSKRSFSGGHSIMQSGFLLVDCQNQATDYMAEPITRSLEQVDDVHQVAVDRQQLDPAVVSARDDCGNVWHALADFLRVFTAGYVANIAPSDRSVWVVDDRLMISDDPDDVEICPYHGALDAMGRRGVYRGVKFDGKSIFFKKLVIPRDDPQYGLLGLIWSMHACDTNRVLSAYINNLFDYFKLNSLEDQPAISGEASVRIIFSSRRKKPFAPKNARIGRIIINEEELVAAIGKLPGVTVEAVEFFEMEFEAQLKMFRKADILMGMHGAGLANLVYTPIDASLIELVPFTWRSPEYFHLSSITGRPYYFWRNTQKKNHIEPDCYELPGKEKAEDPNICRTGTSSTIADVPEVLEVVKQAVADLNRKRDQSR